jgi:anti-sigma regulatory factor (Ser/Thr protein kinase)
VESEIVRLKPRCDRFAPRLVREALGRLCGLGWAVGDAMLVATELVTNAVRHSQATADEELEVVVRRDADRLRISVRDPGTSGRTARVPEQPDAWGGLGLMVVDQLSASWGSQRHADGYEVWAELRLAEASTSEQLANRASVPRIDPAASAPPPA